MFIASLFSRRLRHLGHRPRAHTLQSHRPGFELLEDRRLLAVDFGYAIGLGSSFGLDMGGSVATDAAGNAYVTGMFGGTVDFDPGPGTFNLTDSGGSSSGDVFVAKYSPTGQFVWAGAIEGGGFLANTGTAIAVDHAGNVFVTGGVDDSVDLDPGPGSFPVTAVGTSDGFIVKLDPNGVFLWGGLISGPGGEFINTLHVDGSGNVYLGGGFGSPSGGGADLDPGPGTFNVSGLGFYAIKLDGSGQFQWASSVGGSGGGSVNGIHVDGSGNVLVTGGFIGTQDFDPGPGSLMLTADSSGDTFVWKLDGNGNLIWARSAGGLDPNGEGGMGIATNSAGDVLVSGLFSGTSDFDPGAGVLNLTSAGSHDAFLWKLDSSGNFLTVHQFGGAGFDMATGIAVDSADDEYLFGEFHNSVDFDPGLGTFGLTSAGSSDSFIAKLNSDGTFVWAVSHGGSGQESSANGGPDIAIDPDGNVYSTGRFSSTADFDPDLGVNNLTSSGGFDVFLWKLTQTQPNEAPDAEDLAATVTEDGQVTFTLSAMDAETPVSALVFTITSLPMEGQLSTQAGVPVQVGDTFVGAPTLFYEPGAAREGVGSDGFGYTVTDGGGSGGLLSDTGAVAIGITKAVADGQVSVDGSGIVRVGGTSGNNNIVVTRTLFGSKLQVRIDNHLVSGNIPLGSVEEIRVWGRGGNDKITVLLVDRPTLIHGGTGNDEIIGGLSSNVIFGGVGSDKLVGGIRSDLLVGGDGTDTIMDALGDDLLIGGNVSNQFTDAFLRDVLAQWDEDRSRDGRFEDGLTDDGAVDKMFDSLGDDWFMVGASDSDVDFNPFDQDFVTPV